MNIEQLQKIADQELPRLGGKGYCEGFESGVLSGQKYLANDVLSIIKGLQNVIEGYRNLCDKYSNINKPDKDDKQN
jgi:flagellar biosynthesis/type III secretory pathway protein FliH